MIAERQRLLYLTAEKLYSLLKGKVPEPVDSEGFADETEKIFIEQLNKLITVFSETSQFAREISQGS